MDQPRPEETAISPARALRVELARAADHAFGLALKVIAIRQSRMDLADVIEQIDEDWALYPMVHDDQSVGACVVSQPAVFAFVEQQTLGHLAAQDVAGDRGVTRTDKALTHPLIEQFLRQFDETLEGAPTAFWTQGYRCDDAVPSKHLLTLQLEAAEYRVFDVSISYVGTERTGAMTLMLPIKSKPAPPKPAKNKSKTSQSAPEVARNLRASALPAHVVLQANMCKLRVSLSELRALAPGMTLKLPKNPMKSACVQDRAGRVSIPVDLGQLDGLRAVRLQSGKAVQMTRDTDEEDAEDALELSSAMASIAGLDTPANALAPSQSAQADSMAMGFESDFDANGLDGSGGGDHAETGMMASPMDMGDLDSNMTIDVEDTFAPMPASGDGLDPLGMSEALADAELDALLSET